MRKKNTFQLIFGGGIALMLFAFSSKNSGEISAYQSSMNSESRILKMSVEEALIELGDEKPQHYISKVDLDSARMGEEIVKYGRLKDKSNKRISKFFVCTDCHNLQKESADPSDESPTAVLEYSKKNNVPFLPGSTFYGMYNKRHWYNGDYAKKYGDLVRDTRDTLKNAIQLCATQCSQGRAMTAWELRTVMHYYKTLEFKITDLVFSPNEIKQVEKMLASDKRKAIELIKSKYSDINDATFGTSKIPEIDGYQPSLENGQFIYEKGCLHCHAVYKDITNFDLGMDVLSYKFLNKKLYAYNQYSISHITRYGTYAFNGRKQYMPQYSMENMSDEQMLDLIHFIKTKAEE